jgi:hypothetical protein
MYKIDDHSSSPKLGHRTLTLFFVCIFVLNLLLLSFTACVTIHTVYYNTTMAAMKSYDALRLKIIICDCEYRAVIKYNGAGYNVKRKAKSTYSASTCMYTKDPQPALHRHTPYPNFPTSGAPNLLSLFTKDDI